MIILTKIEELDKAYKAVVSTQILENFNEIVSSISSENTIKIENENRFIDNFDSSYWIEKKNDLDNIVIAEPLTKISIAKAEDRIEAEGYYGEVKEFCEKHELFEHLQKAENIIRRVFGNELIRINYSLSIDPEEDYDQIEINILAKINCEDLLQLEDQLLASFYTAFPNNEDELFVITYAIDE